MCSRFGAIRSREKKSKKCGKKSIAIKLLEQLCRKTNSSIARTPRIMTISNITYYLFNHRLGGPRGPQTGSLIAFTRDSPLVNGFTLFVHVNDWPLRTISSRYYNKAVVLWACANHIPTTLTYSNLVPVLKTES